MNSAIKRELAVMFGLTAAAGGRVLHPRARTALFLASGALGIWSQFKDYSFRRKTAVITGGSRGLGLSIAWNLLEQGASVVLLARDEDELARARKILKRDFPKSRVMIIPCDITDHASLAQALNKAKRETRGIDLLVNNAGSILVGPFSTMVLADFEAQMRLHLLAVVDAIQIALPELKRRQGRILNICSLGGKIAVPHMAAYDASKFAMSGFAQAVRGELAEQGVLMTTAYPTVMRTGSTIQAVFKGDHEKEFRLFDTIDHLPVLSLSADRAAKKVLTAVREGRSEVVLSIPARLREAVAAIFPETVQLLMDFVSPLLPHGKSLKRLTGAQVRGSGPAREEEITYNQAGDGKSAAFNLGLKNKKTRKAKVHETSNTLA